MLICLADIDMIYRSRPHGNQLKNKYPDILDWMVTKESFTEQELNDLGRPIKYKPTT